MTTLAVIERPIASLKPYERKRAPTPRSRSIRSQARSTSSGSRPGAWSIIRNDHGRTWPGGGRKAARMVDVPTIRIEHLSQAEPRLRRGRQPDR